jgi:hypothetical protein
MSIAADWSSLTSDDAALKAIFDHVRNALLAGSIAAIGAFALKHAEGFVSTAGGMVTLLFGLLLFILNVGNGGTKLYNAKAGPLYLFALSQFHLWGAVAVFNTVLARY